MPTRLQKFYRHSIRLPDYDYSQPGFYYVTLCARDKKLMFGEIANGEIYLNEAGSIVQAVWNSMPERFPYVKLDEYTIMPNHMHGIIELLESNVDRANNASRPFQSIVSERSVINSHNARKRAALGEIIRVFKAATTHSIRSKVRPILHGKKIFMNTLSVMIRTWSVFANIFLIIQRSGKATVFMRSLVLACPLVHEAQLWKNSCRFWPRT